MPGHLNAEVKPPQAPVQRAAISKTAPDRRSGGRTSTSQRGTERQGVAWRTRGGGRTAEHGVRRAQYNDLPERAAAVRKH